MSDIILINSVQHGKGSMFIEVGMSLLNAPRLAYYASLFIGIFGIKYFCLITSYVLSTSIRPNSSWYCCTTKSSKFHTGETLDLMSLCLCIKQSISRNFFSSVAIDVPISSRFFSFLICSLFCWLSFMLAFFW